MLLLPSYLQWSKQNNCQNQILSTIVYHKDKPNLELYYLVWRMSPCWNRPQSYERNPQITLKSAIDYPYKVNSHTTKILIRQHFCPIFQSLEYHFHRSKVRPLWFWTLKSAIFQTKIYGSFWGPVGIGLHSVHCCVHCFGHAVCCVHTVHCMLYTCACCVHAVNAVYLLWMLCKLYMLYWSLL